MSTKLDDHPNVLDAAMKAYDREHKEVTARYIRRMARLNCISSVIWAVWGVAMGWLVAIWYF